MNNPVPMVNVWRGQFLECVHLGHGVVCDPTGEILHAWGDPDAVILPRSSCKMIQALPLIESGAADAFGLGDKHVALACASHQAATIHTDLVLPWLEKIGCSDDDLICGPQAPRDRAVKHQMIREGGSPCRYHNVCSGKHTGFLTFGKHMGASGHYTDTQHPLQIAVLDAFQSLTGESSPGFAIDGCSAPNFATTVHGLARSMAYFAASGDDHSARGRAADRLVSAMTTHPELVGGFGRADTELMRACNGNVALKEGADGVFIAIIRDQKIGVALKIMDGNDDAREVAIAAILISLGALDPDHPICARYVNAKRQNVAGLTTGFAGAAPGFPI